MRTQNNNSGKGLTLIELLIAISIIVVLITTVIFIVEPGERLAKARDDQREGHLNAIWHAVKQKTHMEGNWEGCASLPTDNFTAIGTDAGAYNLFSCLVPEYLASEVYDPKEGTLGNTKYSIWQNPVTKDIALRTTAAETQHVFVGGSGPALSFSGNNNVVVSSVANDELDTPYITVSAWVKLASYVPEDKEWCGVVGRSTRSPYALRLHKDGRFFIALTFSDDSMLFGGIGESIPLDKWVHSTITYNGVAAKAYIDGLEVYSATPNKSLKTGLSHNIHIGGFNNTYFYYLNGLIDDVRIYNRALSAAEVSGVYKGTHITDGLVGFWPFSEMQGEIANDRSGNENHGTLLPAGSGPEWTAGR